MPVIQDAEETIAAPSMSRHVPVAVSAQQRESSKPVAEVESARPAARQVVKSNIETSRPVVAVEKSAEVRLESKARAKTVAAPREEAVAQLQRLRTEEAAWGVRGERERSVSAEAVPQGKQTPAQTMEAAPVSRSAEKREAERVDAVKDAAVEMRREVLRVERERVIESEVRSLEAKPQRTPQPAAPIEAKPVEQRTSIHIGTVEVRVITPAPPAPAPLPQRTMENQPARLAPPAAAPSLARSLAWNYGLVQG
jgi:hypothetical protein